MENPLKKHTEHWMAIAPSDLRSKVADCWRIILKSEKTNFSVKTHVQKSVGFDFKTDFGLEMGQWIQVHGKLTHESYV